MGSGLGWLAGDWPSTGSVLDITAVAWTAGSSDGVLATKSERKMLASTCLYSLYAWFHVSDHVSIMASFHMVPVCILLVL